VPLNRSFNLPVATFQQLFDHFDRGDVKTDGVDLKEFLLGFSYWKNKLSAADNNLVLFFSLFDSDRNGEMSMSEFLQMMRYCLSLSFQRAQFETESYVDEVVKRVLRKVGSESGTIREEDLVQYATNNPSFLRTCKEEQVAELFKLYDVDNNGFLDSSELKSMITSQNIANSILPQYLEEKLVKFTDEVFKIMDADNSGTIEFEEFKAWVEQNPHQTEWITSIEKVGNVVDTTQRKIQEVGNMLVTEVEE